MTEKLSQGKQILFVDDEPGFREVLASSFKRRGYQVLCASNGREAFDLIQANPVDVVVSDIRMPGGDGIELLDRTRLLKVGTPIVLLVTGFTEISTEEAYDKGAEALFCKPFGMKTLEQAIVRLLTPPEERWTRASDQVDVELKVDLHFQGISDAVEAKVMSFGRGGMFVRLVKNLCPNTNDTVAFKIAFESIGRSLNGNGVVRWVRTKEALNFPVGCGIEFSYLQESERQLILNLITHKQPRAYIPMK